MRGGKLSGFLNRDAESESHGEYWNGSRPPTGDKLGKLAEMKSELAQPVVELTNQQINAGDDQDIHWLEKCAHPLVIEGKGLGREEGRGRTEKKNIEEKIGGN